MSDETAMRFRFTSFDEEALHGKRSFRKLTVKWSDVAGIGAFKCDMITYEENFLEFISDEGHSVIIGELNSVFGELLKLVVRRFERFDPEWYGKVESSGGSQWIDLLLLAETTPRSAE